MWLWTKVTKKSQWYTIVRNTGNSRESHWTRYRTLITVHNNKWLCDDTPERAGYMAARSGISATLQQPQSWRQEGPWQASLQCDNCKCLLNQERKFHQPVEIYETLVKRKKDVYGESNGKSRKNACTAIHFDIHLKYWESEPMTSTRRCDMLRSRIVFSHPPSYLYRELIHIDIIRRHLLIHKK